MAQRPPLAHVTLAANNSEVGGGEVMLLNIARACEELGVDVTVVGPAHPSGVVTAARRAGHRTVGLEARDRKEWMRALRRWDRTRTGMLWCNGLVPALATAGRPNRIVHLHAVVSPARRGLLALARSGALITLVPSKWMQRQVRGSEVFANWVDPIETTDRTSADDGRFVVGYLGRVSVEKGVPVLAQAVQRLEQREPGRYRLLIAGEPRFVSEQDQRTVDAALSEVAPLLERSGWIEPADFFSRADLVVCPSVSPETFGLVAAEAMSAHTPLIVSDAGALPEVAGVDSGSIVPAGDPDALARAIAERAKQAVLASTDAGYARWQAEFSPEKGLERTRQLLTQVTLS